MRQTLGGLACGRPIEGTVVFLGGPLEHIPELVKRFRSALGLAVRDGIKPPDAHLFAARGAALHGAEEMCIRDSPHIDEALEQVLSDSLPRLRPPRGHPKRKPQVCLPGERTLLDCSARSPYNHCLLYTSL